MIPAVAGFIVHAVIVAAGGCIITAGIIWIDRDLGRGLSRRRD
jgi:hypothetical protein